MILLHAGWHEAIDVEVIRKYLDCVRLLRDYQSSDQDPVYSEVQVTFALLCQKSDCKPFHTPMARYSLFVLKVPLNANKLNPV